MTKGVCDIKGFEDYSGKMTHSQKGYSQYAGCANSSIIREGSIERLAEYTAADDCAIIAAQRPGMGKEENILLNRKAREVLAEKSIGVYQLAGHFEGKEYERCYFVTRPRNMESNSFEQALQKAMREGEVNNEPAIYRKEDRLYYIYANGAIEECNAAGIFDARRTCNAGKGEGKFLFRGVEEPATNLGKQVYAIHNILYIK